MRVLLVDAANVIGSRPDGWWQDRPGAARRLHRSLAAATLPHDLLVLVLEGRARAGVPEGRQGNVRTVHAPASGDDTLVEICASYTADDVTLVTADRGLVARVEGVSVLGPRTLRDQIGI